MKLNVLKQSYKRFFSRYTAAWIAVILLGAVGVVCMQLLPQLPQLIIDRIINPALGAEPVYKSNVFAFLLAGFAPDDYFSMFLRIAVVLAALLLVRYISHYARWNISHTYGVKAEKGIRGAALKKLLSQSGQKLDEYSGGDLIAVCNSDPNAVKDFFTLILPSAIDQFLIIGLAVYFLCRMNYLLTFVPLAAGIAAALLTVKYSASMRKRYGEIRKRAAALNSAVQENINGVRIVRAFAAERTELDKFRAVNDGYRDAYVSQVKSMARWQAVFNSLGQGVGAISIILGVALSLGGKLSLGEFATFLTYIGMFTPALVNITSYLASSQNAAVCGGRLLDFLSQPDLISSRGGAPAFPDKPDLSVKGVSVELNGSDGLKDIDLELPYGKKLGIMGRTGCGKSVLLKALMRLFDLKEGEITANSRPLNEYDLESVRRGFSFVMQDVFLFSETVRGNIAFYNPVEAASESLDKEDKVRGCARLANADGFISDMQQGYDTVVGERGLGLSGGQKQRVSIARALFKDAPVLLLDDCTSALDLATERKILNNLRENYPDRTTVIASHRACAVQDCDEILYMEGGRIIERGTHASLMAMGGRYAEIAASQAAGYAEEIG